jgi:hypothetical protein
MSGYTKDYVRGLVKQYGEVFFVLDSDREYEVHGTKQLSFDDGPSGHKMVTIEGMKGDEYIEVQFPLSAIEHHYSHRDV